MDMSEKKYLDDTQTARLWAKIKALIPDISGKLDKSGGTMTGKLTLDGDPTSDYHAATKKYVDENAGGGSVDSVNGQTGVVVLDASDVGAQSSITANGMLKADGNGNVSAAVAGTDYIASHQDISGKLDKSGGTMTGALTLSGAPTTDLHASTKKYVDDEVADSIPQILYGKLDSTSTDTAMTAQISGLTELKHGTTIILKNGVVTSADGVTLDINSLGAKPIYSSMAATTSVKTVFNINYTMLFTYDTERLSTGCWIMYYGYNARVCDLFYGRIYRRQDGILVFLLINSRRLCRSQVHLCGTCQRHVERQQQDREVHLLQERGHHGRHHQGGRPCGIPV